MTELTTGQISSRRFETPYSIADAISQYPLQGVWDRKIDQLDPDSTAANLCSIDKFRPVQTDMAHRGRDHRESP